MVGRSQEDHNLVVVSQTRTSGTEREKKSNRGFRKVNASVEHGTKMRKTRIIKHVERRRQRETYAFLVNRVKILTSERHSSQ